MLLDSLMRDRLLVGLRLYLSPLGLLLSSSQCRERPSSRPTASQRLVSVPSPSLVVCMCVRKSFSFTSYRHILLLLCVILPAEWLAEALETPFVSFDLCLPGCRSPAPPGPRRYPVSRHASRFFSMETCLQLLLACLCFHPSHAARWVLNNRHTRDSGAGTGRRK